jgi:hypothetical protein
MRHMSLPAWAPRRCHNVRVCRIWQVRHRSHSHRNSRNIRSGGNMIRTTAYALCIILGCWFLTAHANVVTGTIHTMHVNAQLNLAHVYLDGIPTFDGGNCPAAWTGNSLSDEAFMKHIWPLLLAAKMSGTPVLINVSGCNGSYPKIVAVDVEPRGPGL